MFSKLFNSIKSLFIPKYKSVSASTAKKIVAAKTHLLIDVRSSSEYDSGKIKGAINIPLGDLSKRVEELNEYRDKPILVNCLSGARSSSACRFLTSHGFEDVSNLSGGVGAWKALGMKLS